MPLERPLNISRVSNLYTLNRPWNAPRQPAGGGESWVRRDRFRFDRKRARVQRTGIPYSQYIHTWYKIMCCHAQPLPIFSKLERCTYVLLSNQLVTPYWNSGSPSKMVISAVPSGRRSNLVTNIFLTRHVRPFGSGSNDITAVLFYYSTSTNKGHTSHALKKQCNKFNVKYVQHPNRWSIFFE